MLLIMGTSTEFRQTFLSVGHSSRAFLPGLLILFSLFCGCSRYSAGVEDGSAAGLEKNTLVYLKSSSTSAPLSGLDIFVFKDGSIKSLDSYIKVAGQTDGPINVLSGEGDRILAVIANANLNEAQIKGIRSLEDLEAISVSLRDEVAGMPVMSAQKEYFAGLGEPLTLMLEPLASKVTVRLSIRPKGELKGLKATNVSAYLTNVNGSCQLMRQDGFRPVEILNNGRLDTSDMESMRSPGLLKSQPAILREQAGEATYNNFDLYCYPNDVVQESAGSPFTKLVVQADFGGTTYYYPIPINREGFGYKSGRSGILRNVNYVLDVSISKKGSLDPDAPIDGSADITEGSAEFYPGDYVSGTIGDKIHVWCDVYPEDTPVEWDYELIDGDVERGIYTYETDPDGHGMVFTLVGRGTGMVYMEAKGIVNQAFLCVIVVR